jgi:uncharacterized protein
MSKHHSHPAILKRLQRVKGHLAKIISMIEQEAPCLAVAQQLQAVESAITSAKKVYVHDHIDHCFDDEKLGHTKEIRESIAEFKQMTKYL